MTQDDIILSFVIGIASGVVSSILVTLFYRIKDKKIEREKDRQTFFSELKMFFYEFDDTYAQAEDFITTVNKILKFGLSHIYPEQQKWIVLDDRENEVVSSYHEKYFDLISKCYDYRELYEEYRILEKEDYNHELFTLKANLEISLIKLGAHDLMYVGGKFGTVEDAIAYIEKSIGNR